MSDEDPKKRSKSRSPVDEIVQVNKPYIIQILKDGVRTLQFDKSYKEGKINFDQIDKFLLSVDSKNKGPISSYFLIFDDDISISPDLDYAYKLITYKRQKEFMKKYGVSLSYEPKATVFGYRFEQISKNEYVKQYLNLENNMLDIGGLDIGTYKV